MDIKNEVLLRIYLVLMAVVLMAIVIFVKSVKISVTEGEFWRAKSDSLYVRMKPVLAERGNIMAADGSLLATSLPFFDIYFDPNSDAISDKEYFSNLDSLATCIATLVDNSYTPGGYAEYLKQIRADKTVRYVSIKKNATYADLEMIKSFPLFRNGRYKGGLIVRRQSKRERPFRLLAQRTIGYIREGAKPVGLEGTYNKILAGKEGKELMQRVGTDLWVPVNDLSVVEPRNGEDIVTTIDVNIQDITEDALLRALQYHEADHGCAVVMEVKTGAIKAIANLGRSPDGWWETYNYAIGSAVEPGSTFKLASIMALLEEGVGLEDSIDLEMGRKKFYEEEMVDHVVHNIRQAAVKEAFSMSSNVGIASLVNNYYGKDRAGLNAYIRRIKQFKLHLPTGIEIEGEAAPFIKDPNSAADNWSGTTLPWMAIGYESMISPLQLLNLYNTVANDGTMMRPYLVSEIQKMGVTYKKFRPTVIDNRIASKSTIENAKKLLKIVVEEGTAKAIKSDKYSFSGKTGTTQLGYYKLKNKTQVSGYQASFAGFFPSENPVYSCIIVIHAPKEHGFYGGSVAGPVFREIADKLFGSRRELAVTVNSDSRKPVLRNAQLPGYNSGYKQDIARIFDDVKMKYFDAASGSNWTALQVKNDSLMLSPRVVKNKVIPSVTGMGLRDALYLLENLGLKVRFSGYGRVREQTIPPGTTARGQTISLRLE